jgi:multisubunit Na+/H+ antiporter MnhC subunit
MAFNAAILIVWHISIIHKILGLDIFSDVAYICIPFIGVYRGVG